MNFRSPAACLVMMLLLAALALPGCKSKEEKAVEQMIATLNAAADELGKIKTVKDIETHKAGLQGIAKRMDEAEQGMSALSASSDKKLVEKYTPKVEAAQQRLQDEMSRIMRELGPAGAAALQQIAQ